MPAKMAKANFARQPGLAVQREGRAEEIAKI